MLVPKLVAVQAAEDRRDTWHFEEKEPVVAQQPLKSLQKTERVGDVLQRVTAHHDRSGAPFGNDRGGQRLVEMRVDNGMIPGGARLGKTS